MTSLGLPQLLLVLAVIIAMFGVSRLSAQPIETRRRNTRRAAVVWFVLVAFGAMVWLIAPLMRSQ
jgi:uncharacterized membrane protein YozB (DUF420 family)